MPEYDFSNGFIPRQLADIQINLNRRFADIVDPRTGEKPFQNGTDDTILQQVVAIFAEEVSILEGIIAQLALWRDPKTAWGAGLSQVVQINSIMRKPGSGSIVNLEITGRPGTIIPKGTQYGTADGGLVFATDVLTAIQPGGIAMVTATCTTYGPNEPEPGDIAAIIDTIEGVESVRNTHTVAVGTLEETDAELRRRQQQSTNATSYRQIEAIRAAVFNVPGVTFCRAYQNSTLEIDDRGIPGKCVAVLAVGGKDADIADALWKRTPLGIGYYGNVEVPYVSEMGYTEIIRFSRPEEIPIWVKVKIKVVVDDRLQAFPSKGVEMIKDEILNYALHGHTDCAEYGNTGFVPGADIIRSYLYTPINNIGGASVTGIELSTDGGSFAEQDIEIAWNEQGVFDRDRIAVEIING